MPCTSKVRVWYQPHDIPVHYELLCEDKCKDDDDKDCVKKAKTEGDSTQTVKTEYCCCNGCTGGEVTGCHITLVYTRKPPSAPEEIRIVCSGAGCTLPEKCMPFAIEERQVLIPEPDGTYKGKVGRWVDYICACGKKEDGWYK